MDQTAVSSRLIVKVVLVTAATLLGLYLVYQVRTVIELILIAGFFALALAPAVNWLHKRRLPRALAILLVYLSIAAAIFGIGLLLVPPITSGVDKLSHDLPSNVNDLRKNDTFRKYDDRYHITPKIQEQIDQLPSRLGDAASTLQDVTVGVFSKILQLVTILVLAFFLLMEGGRMLDFVFGQMAPDRERRLRKTSADISDAISGYVFGNFVISVLAGTVTYATLRILGIPFALPLAFLYGFLDLIPLVGATIGGILVGIVVAFFDFPGDLIIWIAVTIAYQQVENYMVQPYVYGKAVRVHPLIVIVAILIGASLLGILGALVAIPIAAAMQSAIVDWWGYRQERIEKEKKGSSRGKTRRPKAKPKPKTA